VSDKGHYIETLRRVRKLVKGNRGNIRDPPERSKRRASCGELTRRVRKKKHIYTR